MRLTLIYFLLLHVFFLNGKAYFVSPTGKDTNRGNHWFVPFKTLNKAASLVQPGDTVYILKGDYFSDDDAVLDISRSGLNNAWIVYKNYRNHKPVLHVRNHYGIRLRNANFISIEGLEIRPEGTKGTVLPLSFHQMTGISIEGTYEAPVTNIKIYDNFILGMSRQAMLLRYVDFLTISYNKIYKNAYDGPCKAAIELQNIIYSSQLNSYHNFIQGNTFEKNGGHYSSDSTTCIAALYMDLESNQIVHEGPFILVHNNILYTNEGGGFFLKNVRGCHIVNNTFYKNSEMAGCIAGELFFSESSSCEVINNIFYSSDNKSGSQTAGSTQIHFKNNLYCNTHDFVKGKEDVKGDPQFEEIRIPDHFFNFRLRGNSRAINAGLDTLLSDTDFEGNHRKVDTHVDIGAIEFNNRILPSIKKERVGPGSKGIKTHWISLYTKEQKMYTIWNEQFQDFFIRVFDFQGNLIDINSQIKSEESSFELDFSGFEPGYYYIIAFNEFGNHMERVEVKQRK